MRIFAFCFLSFFLLTCIQCKKDKADEGMGIISCKLIQLNYISGFILDWPVQTYEYQNNKMVKIQFKDSNEVTKVYEQYQYDAEGKLSGIQEFQNMGSGFNQVRDFLFTYDNNRIKSLCVRYLPTQFLNIDSCIYHSSGQLIGTNKFVRNNAGGEIVPTNAETFVYNSRGDLTEIWTKGSTDSVAYKQKVFGYSDDKSNLNQIPRKTIYPVSPYCVVSMQAFQPDGSSAQPWIYTYLFDDKKNIVRITETVSSKSNQSNYRYQCN